MAESTPIDDILLRAAAGDLSDTERERLDGELRTSRELQLSLLAHEHFEIEGEESAADAILCDRIAGAAEDRILGAGAVTGNVTRLGSRRRIPAFRLALAALLFGGVAAAAFGITRLLSSDTDTEASDGSVVQVIQSAPTRALPATPPKAEEPVEEGVSTSALPQDKAAPTPAAVATVAAALSAKDLFEQASEAKRAGKWNEAERLYRQLAKQYPSSQYAAVSEMVLGKRSLQRGDAAGALRWFKRYRGRPGGVLSAEAMWGEAQALGQLGRKTEQEKLLHELKLRYPNSAYAASAASATPSK